jgi:periplasmic divalent cation tolerance protein
MHPNFLVVFCTVPNIKIAKKISKTLVEEKLAACSNILPGLKSIYNWQNEIQSDNEYLLIIKTTEEMFEKLEIRIKNIHPYEVPEIIALPIIKGNSEYLNWIKNNVKK